MNDQWERECAALRAELAELRAVIQTQRPSNGGGRRGASDRDRRRGRTRMVLVALPVVALLAAGGVLYGQDAMTALFIDATGNVGIGTSTPATTLHVAGKGIFGTARDRYWEEAPDGAAVHVLAHSKAGRIYAYSGTPNRPGGASLPLRLQETGGEVLIGQAVADMTTIAGGAVTATDSVAAPTIHDGTPAARRNLSAAVTALQRLLDAIPIIVNTEGIGAYDTGTGVSVLHAPHTHIVLLRIGNKVGVKGVLAITCQPLPVVDAYHHFSWVMDPQYARWFQPQPRERDERIPQPNTFLTMADRVWDWKVGGCKDAAVIPLDFTYGALPLVP